jgi:hypothetical protein
VATVSAERINAIPMLNRPSGPIAAIGDGRSSGYPVLCVFGPPEASKKITLRVGAAIGATSYRASQFRGARFSPLSLDPASNPHASKQELNDRIIASGYETADQPGLLAWIGVVESGATQSSDYVMQFEVWEIAPDELPIFWYVASETRNHIGQRF